MKIWKLLLQKQKFPFFVKATVRTNTILNTTYPQGFEKHLIKWISESRKEVWIERRSPLQLTPLHFPRAPPPHSTFRDHFRRGGNCFLIYRHIHPQDAMMSCRHKRPQPGSGRAQCGIPLKVVLVQLISLQVLRCTHYRVHMQNWWEFIYAT